MDEIVADSDGVIHLRENGLRHNTWCGRSIDDHSVGRGRATCIECIGGPSHLRVEDLVCGKDVLVYLIGHDENGAQVTDPTPVRFTEGRNDTAVHWPGVGKSLNAVGYYRPDGHRLHMTYFDNPVVALEGDTFNLERHAIELRVR